VNLSGLTDVNDFSSPDGLWFDQNGMLWIQTDDGAYTDVTNCMMLAAIPGKVGDGAAAVAAGGTPTIKGANATPPPCGASWSAPRNARSPASP
jgi:secreted PhoX family phosphatase